MTLLYLDDDPDDIGFFILAARLSNKVEQTHATTDASRFMSILENNCNKKLIIFLDINMPESGLEILKQIRAGKDFDALPVIMLSTSSDQDSIAICKKLGATHYSVKPSSIEKLSIIIERAIDVYDDPPNKRIFVISN